MSNLNELLSQHLTPDWSKWLSLDLWTLEQGVALCTGLDPDKVRKGHGKFKTQPACYMQITAYTKILDRLEPSTMVQGALHEGKEKVSKAVIIDWYSKQGGVLCDQIKNHMHLTSRIDAVVGGEGQKPDKRVAIAEIYAHYAGINIVDHEIQMKVDDFTKAINRDISASHLNGLFDITPRQIQRDISEARNNYYTFKHGNRAD